MKNRVLLLAAAAAMALPGIVATPGAKTTVAPPNAPQGAGGPLPQGGIGSLLGDVLRHGGGAGGSPGRPKYKKQRGPGHIAAKRIKRRTRNRLRAKGQFRRAVR